MKKLNKLIKILTKGSGLNYSQLFNLFKYSVSRKGNVLSYAPIAINLFTTDNCNFNCEFCPHHSKLIDKKYEFFHEKTPDFNLEKFKRVLDVFPKTILITFAGVGEPLLNRDLFDMADYAKLKKMYLQIITNGSLMNEEKVERIIANLNILSISVSLNAVNSQKYSESFDGNKGFFEKVIQNIENLVKRKKETKHPLEIGLSFVVHKKNIADTKSFIEFSQKLGVDTVNLLNLIDFGISDFDIENQLYDNDKEIINQFNDLKDFASKSNIKVVLPILMSSEVKKNCNWFFRSISIDGAGNVGGCGRVINPSKEYGNVFKEGKSVWNNNYFQKMREIYLNPEKELFDCCKKCVENN